MPTIGNLLGPLSDAPAEETYKPKFLPRAKSEEEEIRLLKRAGKSFPQAQGMMPVSPQQNLKDVKDIVEMGAMAAIPGGIEAKMLERYPTLKGAGLLKSLGRIGIQTGAGAATGAALGSLQGQPVGGGLSGALAGAVPAVVGETGGYVQRGMAESRGGGGWGRLARVFNKLGEITGLGRLTKGGVNIPDDVGKWKDRYYTEIHAPIKKQMSAVWTDEVPVPKMDELVAAGKEDMLPASAQAKLKVRKDLQAELDKVKDPKARQKIMAANPAAYMQLKQPPGYTFDEVADTSTKLNQAGYTLQGDLRGAVEGKALRQAGQSLRDDIHRIMSTDFQAPKLADAYRTSSKMAHGWEVMHDIGRSGFVEKGAGPDIGAVQETYAKRIDELNEAFGPRQAEMLDILSGGRLSAGNEGAFPFYERSGWGGGIRAHGGGPLMRFAAHVMPPKRIRPDVEPDIGRLLRYGIPRAAITDVEEQAQ